jgi:hypothetical protein
MARQGVVRLRAGVLGAVMLAAATSVPLLAHPIATTAMLMTLSERGVVVTIDSEGAPLLVKLEAFAHREISSRETSAADRHAKLVELQHVLASALEIRADGVTVPLAVTSVEDALDVTPPRAVITVVGVLPANTRAVTFGSSLVMGSYPLTVHREGTTEESVVWLAGPEVSTPVPVAALGGLQGLAAVRRDFLLGFTHILPNGLDHILFVLGLFLLSTRWKAMLAQVSAFTLAHSITLGLTLYGLVSLRAAVVEPLIALSIVYVACENLMTSSLTPWRLALVFCFGLLHGMGFAEALSRLHLERSHFLATLVTFNVGVEGGQLTVIAIAAAAVWLCRVPTSQHRRFIVQPVSVAIAVVGAVWVVQRVFWT